MHGSAMNLLVRGKKRWFVYPSQYNISHIGGGSLNTAYEWATTELPKLRAQGIHASEFIQHPGEVVYVPQGWIHIVVNLEPSVGVAFEVVHGQPKATA
jgi:ribosomal protein L16 Arg81 hydroxylase